jgi:hypothetical protein
MKNEFCIEDRIDILFVCTHSNSSCTLQNQRAICQGWYGPPKGHSQSARRFEVAHNNNIVGFIDFPIGKLSWQQQNMETVPTTATKVQRDGHYFGVDQVGFGTLVHGANAATNRLFAERVSVAGHDNA